MSNRDEIEKALSYIEPHDRDVWVNTAYSLKHELGEEAFDMWDRWSQQSDSYRSRDARSVWKSIKNPTRTIASLFYDARANGYRPDTPYTPPSAEEQARRQAEAAAAREAAQRQQQENHLRVSKTAQRIWRNAAPATLAHPYLAAKGITDPAVLGGIRQSEYQGVLNLQIPIYRDGTLYNLQSISPEGGKHFLKDGLKSGGYTVVGDAADTARGIVVAEGFATAASIHQATGKPVVVAFDAGNMVTVSETLAKNLPPDIPVTIAVDNDASGTGLAKARQAAALFGDRAKAVQPEFTMTQIQQFQRENGLDGQGRPKLPSDFNDLHKLAGIEAVRQAMAEGANLAPQADGFAQAAADQAAEWQDRMQTRGQRQRLSESATPDMKGNAMAQQDTPRETPEAAQTNGIEFDGRRAEVEKNAPKHGADSPNSDTPRPKQSSGVSDGLKPEQSDNTTREPSDVKSEPGQTDAAALLQGRDKKVVLDLNYDTPESLKERYITFEGKLLSPGRQYASPDNPRTVLFTDKGSKLSTAKSDLQTVKDMLEVAKQKGWDSIKIKGSKEFKSLMFVMAESQGIRTSGYSPKPEDLAMVERLRQEYALNGIETAPRQERRSGVSDGLKQEQEQERRPSEQPGRSGDTPVSGKPDVEAISKADKMLAQSGLPSDAVINASHEADTHLGAPMQAIGQGEIRSEAAAAAAQMKAAALQTGYESAKSVYTRKAEKLSKPNKQLLAFHERSMMDTIRGLKGDARTLALKNYYEHTAEKMSGSKLNLPKPMQIPAQAQSPQQQRDTRAQERGNAPEISR
ncbi:LPD7 domain-containing protein [Neisseria sicca]|uniref:LPD7 domain-containing protein n=1 Tax=Neisseria sicca TaxID=490 RepID=UPI0028EBD1A3|nr:LPD7 domain-containing protein [Neisseria sicca]